MIDLLKKNGKFFKANLHCHTINSDGEMTPEQVKELYLKNGYSIVAFTDHRKYIYHEHLNDDKFLTIGAVEIDFQLWNKDGTRDKLRTCHLNFYAKEPKKAEQPPINPVYHVSVINSYIKDMVSNGWLCTLNHPAWSLQPTDEVIAVDNILAMEVYNHGCQTLSNIGDSQGYYSAYLSTGKKAFAVATDDNHCGFDDNGELDFNNDTCGGYIQISMPELNYKNFIDAFENGRFYASTGVEIKELYIDEQTDELVVSCSPVKRIITRGSSTRTSPYAASTKNDITSARLPMEKIRKHHKGFFRVELIAENGARAYSQPYYFE